MVSLLRASYEAIIEKDGFKGAGGGVKEYPGLDLANGCIRHGCDYNDRVFSWCCFHHVFLNLKF